MRMGVTLNLGIATYVIGTVNLNSNLFKLCCFALPFDCIQTTYN